MKLYAVRKIVFIKIVTDEKQFDHCCNEHVGLYPMDTLASRCKQ